MPNYHAAVIFGYAESGIQSDILLFAIIRP